MLCKKDYLRKKESFKTLKAALLNCSFCLGLLCFRIDSRPRIVIAYPMTIHRSYVCIKKTGLWNIRGNAVPLHKNPILTFHMFISLSYRQRAKTKVV